MDAIREWLTFRDQYLQQAGARSAKYERKEYTGQLFPFSVSNFNEIWNRALGKAGLLRKDSRTHRVTMRVHNLRKFFRLRVGRFGRDEAEALMGHLTGLHKIYAHFGDQNGEQRLEEAYSNAIPELSVYGAESHQLRAEATAQREEFQTAISNLSLENSALKARVASAEKDLKTAKKKLEATSHAFNESVDRLIRRIDNLERFREEILNPPKGTAFYSPGPFTSLQKREEEG